MPLACWSRRPRRDGLVMIRLGLTTEPSRAFGIGYPTVAPDGKPCRTIRTSDLKINREMNPGGRKFDSKARGSWNLLQPRSIPSSRLGKVFGVARSPRAAAPLRQHRLVKLVPIVEIIEIHRIFWRRSVIRNAACAENSLSSFIVMIVAANRRIMLLNGVSI